MEQVSTMKRLRPDDLKQSLTNRIRSVNGHVKGIGRMVEEDAYCIDIIHQIQAVKAALDKVSLLILDDHMHHCVTDAIQKGDIGESERVLDELRDVFEALTKV